MIDTLWNFFLETWQLRRDRCHAQDKDDVSKQHTFQVPAYTQAVYSPIPNLFVVICLLHWFELTLDEQVDTHTHKLKVWLAHTEPLAQKGLAKTTRYLAAGHKDIQNFFHTFFVPRPPPV